jgi:hypothetical protein
MPAKAGSPMLPKLKLKLDAAARAKLNADARAKADADAAGPSAQQPMPKRLLTLMLPL